jgi:hypothetical protein
MLFVIGFLMEFLTIFIVFLMLSLYRNKQKIINNTEKKNLLPSLTRNNRLFFNQNFLFRFIL